MDKPKLLDTFCCAGGCSEGYRRAGFEPYGIDIEDQPHYPFPFLKMDALTAMDRLLKGEGLTFSNSETLYLKDFVAIHASPPCQHYSQAFSPLLGYRKEHPDLVEPVRERLSKLKKPCVIENVPKSPLKNYIKLNGTMFGLKTVKERWFELHGFEILFAPAPFENTRGMIKDGKLVGIVGHFKSCPNEIIANKENLAAAYKIDWVMNRHELRQAIPPVYTEFIGKHLMQEVLKKTQSGETEFASRGT